MKPSLPATLTVFALLCLPAVARAGEPPVKIVFDTDMDSDCDDAGALGMLHILADRGEAEILATVVSTGNPWSAACVDAINTYYGRPDLPVGAAKESGPDRISKYAQPIAERFPHDLPPIDEVPQAMEVYRRVLSSQPDGSVVLVTVGYLTNVAALLKLPAEGDEPSGMEIARQKVKAWVCMGGNFVGRPAVDDLALGNNNFTGDKEASYYAVQNWPGRLVFVGREIGSVPSGLLVGARLKELSDDHPVRAVYELWFRGEPKDRHVADQTAVLYAVRGLRDYWHEETDGLMELAPDMTFRWRSQPGGLHSYLLKRQTGGQPNDRQIEQVIEELMMQVPGRPAP